MRYSPIVHRELCIPRLDALPRIQLLELSAGVITKRMVSGHFG